MNGETILIVEDEQPIAHVLTTILSANGYHTLQASTGTLARSIINSHCPRLILLDLGLPDMDGLELLRWLREWSGVPVLIVSAREEENQKVEALDLGADDYITKPFGTSELLARIRVRDLTVDFERRKVTLRGEEVHLTQIEYKIVELIARRPGRVLTYDYIISRIWGPYAVDNNRILRVNMAHIRRKLEDNPAEPYYIRTEIGVGYRMAEE